MKEYINNTSVCRRKTLLKHFEGCVLSNPSGHMCCDVCAETCTCKGAYCDMDVYLPLHQLDNMDVETNIRHVNNTQKEQLHKRLWQLQKTIVVREGSRAMSHVTYPTTLMQFGKYQIEQVIEHCDKIFTLENVMDYVEIWNKKYAVSIFKIIKDVFCDIERDITDSDSDSDSSDDMPADSVSLSDDMVIDKSFLSLINTSDWNVESILGSSYEAEVDSLSDIVHDTELNYEGFQETLDFTNKM